MSEFKDERFNFAVLEVFEGFRPIVVGIFHILTDARLMAQKLTEELPQITGRSFEIRKISKTITIELLSVSDESIPREV